MFLHSDITFFVLMLVWMVLQDGQVIFRVWSLQ